MKTMKKLPKKSQLQQRASKLPLSPGIYFFIGQSNKILYIGRATSLKKRVGQYFRKDLEPRLAEMMSLARRIKFVKTDTLLDAVILEANLIKRYWPKYNIKDKDDRSFVHIVIPQKDFAYPLVVRQRELKKFPLARHQIFGPYQNATLLKNALRLIRRIFPYSTCRPNSGQACFDYQIGLCPGSCLGAISAFDYQKNIKNIILLLQGDKKRLLKKLKAENPEAASALKQLQDVTLITADELANWSRPVNRIEGYDVSHLSGRETVGALAVFIACQPDKSQYRLFNIGAAVGDDLRALEEMIRRRFNHVEWPRPDIILIDGGRPQVDFIQKVLELKNINLPLIGLSKFGGDQLVFAKGASKSIKELAAGIKKTLVKIRDEAHRFSNSARRRKMNLPRR